MAEKRGVNSGLFTKELQVLIGMNTTICLTERTLQLTKNNWQE